MYKKIALVVVSILFLVVFSIPVNAEEPKIEDYIFIWHAAKAGDVAMDIEKTREKLQVVLKSPGGALARISATPSQAEVIGAVLKKTNEYSDDSPGLNRTLFRHFSLPQFNNINNSSMLENCVCCV